MTTSFEPVPSSLYDEREIRENVISPYNLDFEIGRNCRDQLKCLAQIPRVQSYENSWGFLIYCTVYTPESEITFSTALVRLFSYVENVIFSDVRPWGSYLERFLDSAPNQELVRRFTNQVIQDANLLRDYGTDKIGWLFAKWINSHLGQDPDKIASKHPRFQVCLLIDQEVLDDILRLPSDPAACTDDKFYRAIKVVTANRGRGSQSLRVAIIRLPALWFSLLDTPILGIENSALETNTWVGRKLT